MNKFIAQFAIFVSVIFASALTNAAQLTLEEIYQKLNVSPSGATAEDLKAVYQKYSKLKGNKALALAWTPNDYSIGYGYKAASELAASHTAMAHCAKWQKDNNIGGQWSACVAGTARA